MSACTVGLSQFGPDCGREPAVPVKAMCVHEHLQKAFVCEDCFRLYREGRAPCCMLCAVLGCVDCPIQLVMEVAR